MACEPPKRRKLTKVEKDAIYSKCNGHCAYCGKEITQKEMQVDHVIPMMFYAAYKAAEVDIDDMPNFLPAYRSCNNYKSSLTLEKFRAAIERWPQVLQRDSVTYRNAVRFGQVSPTPKPCVFYFEKLGVPIIKEMEIIS